MVLITLPHCIAVHSEPIQIPRCYCQCFTQNFCLRPGGSVNEVIGFLCLGNMGTIGWETSDFNPLRAKPNIWAIQFRCLHGPGWISESVSAFHSTGSRDTCLDSNSGHDRRGQPVSFRFEGLPCSSAQSKQDNNTYTWIWERYCQMWKWR